MKGIVKLVVFVAILYAVFTYGRPFLEDLAGGSGLGPSGGGGSEPMRCVEAANVAYDNAADNTLPRAKPGGDRDRWSSSYQLARGRIEKARDACSCSEDACSTARQAMTRLQSLLDGFDGAMSGGGAPPLNAARDLEGILNLLAKARREAQ